MQRLDKLLAASGLGSRTQVKKILKEKKVTVNGNVVVSGDEKIDVYNDIVTYMGQVLNVKEYKEHTYLMLNKPMGVVSATQDNLFETVIDILPKEFKRKGLFPVGRLDKDTEGLLIITDDGDFSHKITSPQKKIFKTYNALIDGEIIQDDIWAFEQGLVFKDGTKCLPAKLRVCKDITSLNLPDELKKRFINNRDLKNRPLTNVEVEICEGKFHQVKKMFLAIGKEVLYLKRSKIGNLQLDVSLNKGECRKLDKLEILDIFTSNVHKKIQ